MFERFTDRARRVLVLAQEEARLLNHGFLGTEHVLIGLVHEGEGVAAKALEPYGIGLDDVRQRVKDRVGPSGGEVVGAPPFTSRAKKVLELSLREALKLGHNYIGTEHLLLGILREPDSVAAQILASYDVPSLDDVRKRVTTLLHGYQSGSAAGFTPAGATLRERAQMQAGSEGEGTPTGSHHYLLAILADTTCLAAHALQALGVTEAALREKLAELDTEGTSDAMPTQRKTVVFEVAPGITLRADDEALLEGVDIDEIKRRLGGA